MADYINTTNTIGFYKFSKFPNWTNNSILNSDTELEWKVHRKTWAYDPTTGDPIGILYDPNSVATKYTQQYRSRPSSLILPESTCIVANLPSSLKTNNTLTVNNGQYGGIRSLMGAITIEFWVYIKSGINKSSSAIYSSVTNTSASAMPTVTQTSQYSNPFLFSYGRINNNLQERTLYYDYFSDKGWNNKSVTKYYESSLFLNLAYDVYYKKFLFATTTTRSTIVSGYVNQSYTPGYSNLYYYNTIGNTNQFPPNRWYHIAIVLENGNSASASVPYGKTHTKIFVNGKKMIEHNISKTSENSNGIHVSSMPIYQDDGSYISIGNRLAGNQSGDFIYNWTSIDPDTNKFLETPKFQDIIIDDLRITKGVLYTTDFTPPGINGYELLYVDDDVYGYDDTYQFVKIAPNWSSKTDAAKWSIIKTMTDYMQITVDDAKSVITPSSNDIHMELYHSDDANKTCYIIEDSYETTIKPFELLPNPLPGSDIKKIDFTYSISTNTNSVIKVLLTTDLETYKTYNFELNSWVNTPLEDISSYGILIDQVKNIPEADVMSLGDNFAFAYFLHLEPYEADCNINKLALDVSLTYAQKHCNQSIANYEYPMFNKLKVIFYEDGEFKVNYMDKP